MLMIDRRAGSFELASIEPLRSLLPTCDTCHGRLHSYCKTCKGSGKQLWTLKSADVCFRAKGPDGGIMAGVEIKSISDYLQSFMSARLQYTQMRDMSARYNLRFILIVGRCRPDKNGLIEIFNESKNKWDEPHTAFKYDNFIKSRLTPSICNRFIIDFAETYDLAARWISNLYEIWTKPFYTHSSMRVMTDLGDIDDETERREKETRDFLVAGRFGDQDCLGLTSQPLDARTQQVMKFARAMPHVGYERALAVARHFDSWYDAVNGTQAQWEAIQVIDAQGGSRRLGPKNAARFLRSIHLGRKSKK